MSKIRTTYTAALDSGEEVELQFEPTDWHDVLTERVGNKIVVAYLVVDSDSDSSNPMENDSQGNIYTRPPRYGRGGVVTDDMSELLSALRLDGENEVNPNVVFKINGVSASLEDHAATEFMEINGGYDLTIEWLATQDSDHDTEDEDLAIRCYNDIYNEIVSGDFKFDEHQELMLKLYAQHWREIVGPFVVPISYCASNHGPGTTSVSVTTWDGDADDLPDGVWVADKGAQENITSNPLPRGVRVDYSNKENCWRVMHEVPGGVNQKFEGPDAHIHGRARDFALTLGPGDIAWQAELYAASILSEYVDWCNGNVYGCVVETFVKAGEDDDAWEPVDVDSCWGFIGDEYPEQALRDEFFNPAVEAVRKEQA